MKHLTQKPKNKEFDKVLFGLIICLFLSAIVIVYSASANYSYKHYNYKTYKLALRHAMFGLTGFVMMIFLISANLNKIRENINIIMLVMLVSLVLVLNSKTGFSAGGSRRWINFYFFKPQPSEFAKIGIILFLSDYIAKKQRDMKNFIDGIIAPLCVVTIFAFLIYIEPDLSTTIIIFSLTIAMLFLGGANLKHLIPIILAGFIAAIVLIQFSTYQKARITGWLHPEKDPMGKGFHLNMSKIAISSGGFSGVGLGKSNLKVSGLPEPHTDFIFSIICEELGFFGGVFFLLIFALLIYRGFKIVYKTKDLFYKFTAFGMTMLIAIHVIINVSVVTGLFPTTGITLPFFSYGGSSFITFLIAMGILLNVSTKVKN